MIYQLPKYTTGVVTYYVSKFWSFLKPLSQSATVCLQRPPPPLFFFFFLFKTLKLLQTLYNYINKIRNNLWVTKTKMCVARYTNKIWAQKCFNTIKSYYINNNIMKQSNHIDIMLIIISKFVFVYDEKTKTKP